MPVVTSRQAHADWCGCAACLCDRPTLHDSPAAGIDSRVAAGDGDLDLPAAGTDCRVAAGVGDLGLPAAGIDSRAAAGTSSTSQSARPSLPPPTRPASGDGHESPHRAGGHLDQRGAARRARQTYRGVCSVCGRSMVLLRSGLLTKHGPVGVSCAGSGNPPRSGVAADPTVPSASLDLSALQQRLAANRGRLVKRIPKASRNMAATALTSKINEVVGRNDIASWCSLLCFALPQRVSDAPREAAKTLHLWPLG